MHPLISVIIAAYNADKYIKEAIDSVLNQTYKNFELIVIDDGSTDKTAQIAKSYKGKLKYVYKENGGVSTARNTGIKLAQGEFVAFLDADDVWIENKLHDQVEHLNKNEDLAMIFTNMIIIDESGENVLGHFNSKESIPYDGFIFEYFLKKPVLYPSTLLIKKNVFEEIGYFNEKLKSCDDTDLFFRAFQYVQVGLVEKELVRYREVENSLSRSMRSHECHITMLSEFLDNNPNILEKYEDLIDIYWHNIYLHYALNLYCTDKFKESRKKFLISLKYKKTLRAVTVYFKSYIKQFYVFIKTKTHN